MHWVTLPDADIGGKSETADRLGLSIRTESPPKLRSLWNADTYTAYGQANAKVRVNGCPGRWISLVVVDFVTEWNVLLGSKTLEAIGYLLKSSAMERKHTTQPTIEILEERNMCAPEGPEKAPVVQRKMQVSVGLPKEYFLPMKDAEFHKYDKMYPSVSRENISERLTTHYDKKTEEALLEALLPHKAALREKFVKKRIEYGIDEPGTDHAQVPIFSVEKPGTSDCQVLFDDSSNSTTNMQKVGLQLPIPMEHALFVRDAKILTSLDLAFFFTAICLDKNVRDY
ncbi:hypothetical protein BDF14DRAFT_1886832 [Spinellus fusiger]|nr:hypothetical protein BDF14DRAFT_1886832 [Spinellus fusiger]